MVDEQQTRGAISDDELDAVLGGLPTVEAPEDAFEAMWARRQEAFSPAANEKTPVPWKGWAAGLAMAAAAVWLVADPALPRSGTANGAATLDLPGDGAIVSEDGARLSYETGLFGRTDVEQQQGRVFYRAPKGEAFSVRTPAGLVESLGTSFAVEISEMTSQAILSKQSIVAGALGAALAAAVVITVYEGNVRFTPEQGPPTELRAGQSGSSAGRALVKTPPERVQDQTRALKQQVQTLEAQLKGYMLAEANDTSPLAAENKRLREKVAALSQKLDVEEEMRAGNEGHAFAFPPEVGDAYRGEALRQLFTDKLKAAGLDGDIEAVDCSEFPCIVYGKAKMEGDDRSGLDKAFRDMNKMIAGEFPPASHHYSTSVWGGIDEGPNQNVQSNVFGFAIYPKDSVAEDQLNEMKRRLRYRNTQYADQFLQ